MAPCGVSSIDKDYTEGNAATTSTEKYRRELILILPCGISYDGKTDNVKVIRLLERCEDFVLLDRFIWADNQDVCFPILRFICSSRTRPNTTHIAHHHNENINMVIDENRRQN